MNKSLVFQLAVLLASLLAACGSQNGIMLSGDEKGEVLAFSEAKTDNLMAGMNAGDYAVFSKDFDQTMRNGPDVLCGGAYQGGYNPGGEDIHERSELILSVLEKARKGEIRNGNRSSVKLIQQEITRSIDR